MQPSPLMVSSLDISSREYSMRAFVLRSWWPLYSVCGWPRVCCTFLEAHLRGVLSWTRHAALFPSIIELHQPISIILKSKMIFQRFQSELKVSCNFVSIQIRECHLFSEINCKLLRKWLRFSSCNDCQLLWRKKTARKQRYQNHCRNDTSRNFTQIVFCKYFNFC